LLTCWIALHRRYRDQGRGAARHRQRQSLARPAGQDHFATPTERRSDPRARILQRGARGAPGAVRARRIGPDRKAVFERRARLVAQRRGRGVVQIEALIGI